MKTKMNWDAVGIGTSVACAFHCAVLPFLLSSLPLFGIDIINNTEFEIFMIVLAFFIGAFALLQGWKKHHHNLLPLFIFFAGICFLLAKQIWHQWQFWFLIPAVILIVTAHYFNYRLSAKINRCI